jgi:hypothetical protein
MQGALLRMNEKEFGFVIKRFLPNKTTFCMVTRTQGKVTVAMKRVRQCSMLWPGMFVSFFYSQRDHQRIHAEGVEILSVFPSSTFEDTTWLYHLLELCYFFIPSHNVCSEIFNFLLKIFIVMNYKVLIEPHIEVMHEISIIKLLILFGFQPREKIFKLSEVFDNLPDHSIDFENEQKVELVKNQLEAVCPQLIKEAKKWAETCLHSHPSFRSFKTVKIQQVP